MYDAKAVSNSRRWFCFGRRKNTSAEDNVLPPDTCISIRNVNMTFKGPWWKFFSRKVVAISDLSLDIPKTGIFVLLGSNG